jgi:hypothetical protein
MWRCSNVSTRAEPSARIPAALAGQSSIVPEAVNRGKCGAAVVSVRGLDRLRGSRLHWQVSPICIVSKAVNSRKCGAAESSVRRMDHLRGSRLHWQVSPV